MKLLLPFLAAVTAQSASLTPYRSCSNCTNGYACGVCLETIPSSECPRRWSGGSAFNLRDDCHGLPVDQMCEADGECGTSNDANNCDYRDVYKAVRCTVDMPLAPPPSPSQPLPLCSVLACDAGRECGICLRALHTGAPQYDVCPAGYQADWGMRTCDQVADGELCEADGECGTVRRRPASAFGPSKGPSARPLAAPRARAAAAARLVCFLLHAAAATACVPAGFFPHPPVT